MLTHVLTMTTTHKIPSLVLVAGRLVVLVEVGLEGKGLGAALALVVLKGAVRLHVRAQVGPVGEAFAAVRAAEGFVAGVATHVSLDGGNF